MDRTIREDDQIWKLVLTTIKHAARTLPKPARTPVFSDWLIVAMYLWSVWHGRCLSWACDRAHYGRLFRPRKLPSISQFTRRIASDRCQALLQAVHLDLAEAHLASPLHYIDGKPMLVSPVSKDRQAKRGRVSGGFAKGYKLHALAKENGLLTLWAATGLNEAECPVARLLYPLLPMQADGALLLGDTNYDDKQAGKDLAARNCGFLTPTKGQATHPVTLRQMGPLRRELLEVWQKHEPLVKLVLGQRLKIENIFSQLCELTRLPAFVRGLARVRRWAGGQIIFYNAKIRVRMAAAKAPAAA